MERHYDTTGRVHLKSNEPTMHDIEEFDIPGIYPNCIPTLNDRPLTKQEYAMIRQYVYLRTHRSLSSSAIRVLVTSAKKNGTKFETIISYGVRAGLLAKLAS